MAVEEAKRDGVQRSYSAEKQDIEHAEQVSDTSPTPLENNLGESVVATWKTWAVIFVSDITSSQRSSYHTDVTRSSHRPSVCHSGLSPRPRHSKGNFLSHSGTQILWHGTFQPTQPGIQSVSFSRAQILIFLVDDSSSFSEMHAAVLASSLSQLRRGLLNLLPV